MAVALLHAPCRPHLPLPLIPVAVASLSVLLARGGAGSVSGDDVQLINAQPSVGEYAISDILTGRSGSNSHSIKERFTYRLSYFSRFVNVGDRQPSEQVPVAGTWEVMAPR